MGEPLAQQVWQNHKNKQVGAGPGRTEGRRSKSPWQWPLKPPPPGTLTPTPPQGSITNIRCARSPVGRGPGCVSCSLSALAC